MVLLHTDQNIAILEHMKSVLLDQGIPCFTKNTNPTGPANGEVPPIICRPEIWIRNASDGDRATALVKDLMTPLQATDWTCAPCNEPIEGQFSHCWQCGEARAS